MMAVGLYVLVITGAGCRTEKDQSTPAAKVPAASLVFRAQELPFEYERGETGSAWPVETTGGGVGLLDFDGDGRLDIFLAQGGPLRSDPNSHFPSDVLLKNLGDGRFEDVSTQVGLTPMGYGQGLTVADYDADGDPDVYVTRYGRNTLWRNDRQRGRFTDVTAEAGVGCESWSLAAAFGDYDGDGDLDLFVANYFVFDPAKAPFRRDPKTGAADYGLPQDFNGLPDVLYRNEGDGHFRDVTAAAGVAGSGAAWAYWRPTLMATADSTGLSPTTAQSNAPLAQPGRWYVRGYCRPSRVGGQRSGASRSQYGNRLR